MMIPNKRTPMKHEEKSRSQKEIQKGKQNIENIIYITIISTMGEWGTLRHVYFHFLLRCFSQF